MGEKIAHMGTLKGKVLVFGGVYSNLQALQALIQVAKDEGIVPENCICTGDIVGYCAQPEETVQLFRDWGATSIAGNVELQLHEGADDCGCDFKEGSRCDGFSKLWYPYAKRRLSDASIKWMGELPDHIHFNYAGKNISVIHGSAQNVSEFIFESTSTEIKLQNFAVTKSDVILAGHCGLPFHHKINNKLWLNAGVIGMPANDGTNDVWYMLLDDTDGDLKYTHRSLNYDHPTAYTQMKANHLPIEYAQTLLSGVWDNMEILPELEKMEQGIAIQLDKTRTKDTATKNTQKDGRFILRP